MIQYKDLTEEQKDILCNGWGPKAAGAVVPELFLHEICDEHDFDYWIGGSVIDRFKADWKLLTNGLKKAKRCEYPVCFIYWLAVRVGGASCFHYGKKRNEFDLAVAIESKQIV